MAAVAPTARHQLDRRNQHDSTHALQGLSNRRWRRSSLRRLQRNSNRRSRKTFIWAEGESIVGSGDVYFAQILTAWVPASTPSLAEIFQRESLPVRELKQFCRYVRNAT